MVWENCTVTHHSDSTGSVYAGDIVTGNITMEFIKKIYIENIDFKILGIAKAHWTRPRPTTPFIKIYSERRKLLHINMDVFGNTFGRIVNPGTYNFPFHFALPEDLLSSFESPIAKVRYCMKIETKKGMRKHKMTVPFVVTGNLNLNSVEEFLVPSTLIFKKTCWNSKNISFRLKMYKGFASKQKIPLQLKIDNENKARMSKIRVHLIQKVKYSIFDGHAEEERSMYHVECNKLWNTVSETCNFTLDIPSITPSTVYTRDAMIVISYVLRVEINFLFHFTLYEDIPVTIATVPVIHNEFDD